MRESRIALACAFAALPACANSLTLDAVSPGNTSVPTSEPVWIILLGIVLVGAGAITRMRMTKRRSE